MFFSLTDPDDRIQFWTADELILPPELKKTLKYGDLTCKPRFVLYLEGEKKEEILGADFSKIEQNIQKYVPALDD